MKSESSSEVELFAHTMNACSHRLARPTLELIKALELTGILDYRQQSRIDEMNQYALDSYPTISYRHDDKKAIDPYAEARTEDDVSVASSGSTSLSQKI